MFLYISSSQRTTQCASPATTWTAPMPSTRSGHAPVPARHCTVPQSGEVSCGEKVL